MPPCRSMRQPRSFLCDVFFATRAAAARLAAIVGAARIGIALKFGVSLGPIAFVGATRASPNV